MKSFSLKELAVLLSAQLVGDPEHLIHGVETLDDAGPEDLSFLANTRYVEAMKRSQAGAICVHSATILSGNRNYLLSEDPSATFQKAVEAFHPLSSGTGFRGIHPTAVIHESVQIGHDVTIGPHVSIDRGCTIATGTTIGSNVSIGYEVHIGTHCTIYSNCTIREKSQLGNRVILQPGAVIGSCGFGYIQDRLGRHIKLEQLGTVILEDDVEIGANTTIDRSRFKSTIIRRGSKIDNLCQIAHNVEVGDDTIMAAQGGIAGSAKLGKRGMFGGQVGILGHVKLKDDVKIASRGGVSKSLKAGIYRGSPALPIAEYNRQEVYVRKLEEYVERIKQLEQKLAASSL